MNKKILLIFKDPRLNPDDNIEPIGAVSYRGFIGYNGNNKIVSSYFNKDVALNKHFCFKQKYNKVTNIWSIDKNSLKKNIKESAKRCINDRNIIMNIDLYMFINSDAKVVKEYESRKSCTHKAVVDYIYEKEWEDYIHTYYPIQAVFDLSCVDKAIPSTCLHTIFDQMVKDDIIDSYIISE